MGWRCKPHTHKRSGDLTNLSLAGTKIGLSFLRSLLLNALRREPYTVYKKVQELPFIGKCPNYL